MTTCECSCVDWRVNVRAQLLVNKNRRLQSVSYCWCSASDRHIDLSISLHSSGYYTQGRLCPLTAAVELFRSHSVKVKSFHLSWLIFGGCPILNFFCRYPICRYYTEHLISDFDISRRRNPVLCHCDNNSLSLHATIFRSHYLGVT